LPDQLDAAKAGPLFCGGITVFNPIVQFDIKPTARVGVIGIGGLGHIALKFLKAWGCEVTAFSSSPDKETEAKELGATHFINSRDPEALQSVQNYFDFIISTVNVNLDWGLYIAIEFASRHGIEPVTETYAISQVNEAMEKLRTGQPKYRLVLQMK